MDDYYFSVQKSTHCCAIYELQGLGEVPNENYVQAIRERAKSAGHPHVLPLLIQFSDADERGHGERLYQKLLELGYHCDRIQLGLNPKSNNHVTLYHWFANKNNKAASLVKEYAIGQETERAQSRSAARTGTTEGSTRRRRAGYLRLGSRTRA